MPGTVIEGPAVSLSCQSSPRATAPAEASANGSIAVANNFWGKEDAGVQPLLERMHNAKVTSDEVKAFYNSTSPPLYKLGAITFLKKKPG